MARPMIRSWQGANAHNPYEPALVKVPGPWVPAMVSLLNMLAKHRDKGLMVTNVGPMSVAAKAGILRGDILLRYGDRDLQQSSTLRRLTASVAGSGEQVIVTAFRGGREICFEVPEGSLGITVSAMFRHLIPAIHGEKSRP